MANNEQYTAEMVWESALQNELDSAWEQTGKPLEAGASRYFAARNLGLYADMFGVDEQECNAYARSQYKDFDWARAQKGE